MNKICFTSDVYVRSSRRVFDMGALAGSTNQPSTCAALERVRFGCTLTSSHSCGSITTLWPEVATTNVRMHKLDRKPGIAVGDERYRGTRPFYQPKSGQNHFAATAHAPLWTFTGLKVAIPDMYRTVPRPSGVPIPSMYGNAVSAPLWERMPFRKPGDSASVKEA